MLSGLSDWKRLVALWNDEFLILRKLFMLDFRTSVLGYWRPIVAHWNDKFVEIRS